MKPRPLAVIRNRRLNSVALLDPLRSVQFSVPLLSPLPSPLPTPPDQSSPSPVEEGQRRCMHACSTCSRAGHTVTSKLPSSTQSPPPLRTASQPQPSCTHACMHPACLAERVQAMLQEPLDHLLNQPCLTDDGEVHPVHARPQCWTDAHATHDAALDFRDAAVLVAKRESTHPGQGTGAN